MAFDFSKLKGKKVEKGSAKEEALKNVFGGIAKDASKKIAGNLGNLKKVTVASNDKDGLKSGLEKAKEMLDKDVVGAPMESSENLGDFEEGSKSEEGSESAEEKMQEIEADIEGLDESQLKAIMEKIQAKLASC